jgi:hypothetical protein
VIEIAIRISHVVHAQLVKASKGNLRASDALSKVHLDMMNSNHTTILADAATVPALAEWSTS